MPRDARSGTFFAAPPVATGAPPSAIGVVGCLGRPIRAGKGSGSLPNARWNDTEPAQSDA